MDIALVIRNWLFGWYIVEFEQGWADRAELYGKRLIERIAEKLTARLGRGFSKRSLEQYRRFYDSYPEIAQAVPAQSLCMNRRSGDTVPVNVWKIPVPVVQQ